MTHGKNGSEKFGDRQNWIPMLALSTLYNPGKLLKVSETPFLVKGSKVTLDHGEVSA